MGKKLQALCVSRIRPLVRVRSPQNNVEKNEKNQVDQGNLNHANLDKEDDIKHEKLKQPAGRKIMVVVDSRSSPQSKVALQWTLTHTVQSHDSLILLYVAKITKQGVEGTSKKTSPKIYELLHSMKKTCQSKRPEVQVEIKMVEGKEKGPTIVEEARNQGVSLLVLGQKKRSTTWRLLLMWAGDKVATGGGGGGGVGMVEYCIQNADCMALAVRRKSKRAGGYLITTKRQKDFWLLA